MLRTPHGPHLADWLKDSAVFEVMLNLDDRLWVDRRGGVRAPHGT